MFASILNKFLNTQDPTIESLLENALKGDVSSQKMLGAHYSKGTGGVPMDFQESFRWFHVAAKQGDDSAQYTLGLLYEAGLGIGLDDKESIRWLRLAAEQGNTKAQLHLGLRLAEGVVAPKDLVHAYAYFNLAAAQGNKAGKGYRDLLEKELTPTQLEKAQDLSRKLNEAIEQKAKK